MESVSQKSLFVEMFGDYPLIRVLDFLLENYIFDYSKQAIAKESGISRNTLETFFDKLIEKKLVIKTRKVGKSEMYMINKENPIVQQLMAINKKLMLEYLDKEEQLVQQEKAIAKPVKA